MSSVRDKKIVAIEQTVRTVNERLAVTGKSGEFEFHVETHTVFFTVLKPTIDVMPYEKPISGSPVGGYKVKVFWTSKLRDAGVFASGLATAARYFNEYSPLKNST
jgi:hypothetical protein